ncbi:protein ELYS [Coregonus clupeaformis]|uniref:protein ELYS n=1 Tax=Coregonus clupeaformis TaxID=59861 RepID=UPI001E1C640C|nr:protein ELYS [Coregonus clupeaformis]
MRDLAAQVTSSLLRFPGVTVDALGEDEITLDTVLHGKFTVGRSALAWLACGPQLEVVHAVTGERLSAYCFCGRGEHPPSVLVARDFSWLKRTGLLVGLEEAQGSVLCLYDLGISRVVKAVVIPGRIRAIEPLVSYGGASASTQHLHQSLRWFFGMAAVVTDLGHVLLVDLCLDDLSCSQSELEASDLEVVSKSLAEIPRLREQETRQGRHLCLQLSSPTGTGATALQYIPRTNQLAVGFSDGYLQLWNMKTLKKEYHSQLEGGRVPVYAFTFQEPENDPRNCCYLWAVQSAQDHEGDVVSLHLLQLAFSERKCLASGKILYEGLEYCEERYSQELSSTAFPLRAQATNTRLLSCQTIEKFRHHPDRDDSMNEVASPDTSVSIFSWQVKAYGQGNPSTYIGVFDINRWYHAQMPDSLRTGESLLSCPYLAVWSLDSVVEMTSPCPMLDVLVHERSLSRGLPYTCPPPEQFFNPTTYNFDATCLLNTGLVHLTCSGYQKETLSFLKKAAPCSSDVISNGYSRCLMSGLLSSGLADVQPSSLSQEEQLDAILSTAIETSSLGLITSCIKQWTAEEQPGSAVNLRYILEWAWNKVVHTKEQLDGICAPLFDSSSNFTDSPTLQLLQHSQRLLGNLSTIFHCLLSEAQELTQPGLLGLINKNQVSSLISQYAQVVLWFCRTGLLPEGSDDDAVQISRPFYSYSVIQNYYTIRREELQQLSKGKWCADCLMIDGLVAQCGDRLVDLWKRDEGGTGQYPPPTLHGLLDIYLLENIDESAKHAIVIYLLLDVMYSFPNKSGASVESFPTAFAIPIGLVKLVQGLWLLDHHDHQNSLELLLHPTASPSLWGWQHGRVLHALMCQGQHGIALRYLHVMKPPLSSTAQAQLCLSVLLHNRCLVEAWAMLRQHSNRLNTEALLRFLYETCQELGLMKELLKLPLGLAEQECLERFLQGTGGLQNRELLMVHYLQQANYVPALQLNHTLKMNMVNERDPKLKERTNTRNSILDQYGKVLPRVQRRLATERAKPYHHPSTILREVSRPQPLSTIAKRSANENVLTRAAFINSVLSKIEEVWVGKNPTPQSTPLKSPRAVEVLCPSPLFPSRDLPEAFVGTPITMTSKRKSRLLDLVVHPSQTTPPEGSRPLLTPPRAASSWNPPKSINKAPELSLLQTPQVVKRARALAASGPVFSAFTPQSILRSSLRPTPVATPSASPGRSVTPPLCPKESRITFIEETASPKPEKGPLCWSNGIATENEISLLTRGSPLSKVGLEAWTSHPDEEEEEVKVTHVKFLPPPVREPPERGESESGSSVQEVTMVTTLPSTLPGRLSLGLETSQASVLSTDTTLEFHDAPLPEDLEREEELQQPANEVTDEEEEKEVVVNLKTPAVLEAQLSKEEVQPAAANELTLLPSVEEGQNKDQEVTEEAVNSQEEVAEEEPDQEVEQMEVSPEQEEAEEEVVVEPRLTRAVEPTPDTEVVEESNLSQEVIDMLNHEHEVEVVEEEAPKEDESQPTEPMEPVDATEHTDLDEFVERHLFGNDLSPPLTRSGIHKASVNWTSFNSERVCDVVKEEESAPTAVPLALTTQKGVASVAASDPTGTDSHSVVILNDSEELSSAVSEEEDEESDAPAEEDSGSEVEVIEEVQGNGRQRAPLPLPSLFLDQLPPLQPHPQFLPALSEQDAAVRSLVTPEADLKMVEDDIEGEVVVVRLGVGGDEGVCYTELKPSTTLLVPLELVEEQGQALADGARLGLTEVVEGSEPEVPPSGAHSSFSLMLEDGDDDADTVPLEVPLEPSKHLTTEEADGTSDTPAADPEVICLGTDNQDTPLADAEPLQEQETELDTLEGMDTLGGIMDSWTEAETGLTEAMSVENVPLVTDVLPESSKAKPARSAEDVDTYHVEEPDEIPADSGPTEEEQPSPVLDENEQPNGAREETEEVTVSCACREEEMKADDVELEAEEEIEEYVSVPADLLLSQVESNGPIQSDNHEPAHGEAISEVAAILEEEIAQTRKPSTASAEEKKPDKTSNSQSESVEEILVGVRKAPSTPMRRATKQRKMMVKFTSVEAERPGSEDQRPAGPTEMETDSQVPVTPRRITRSGRHGQDSRVPVTPRRSARKTESQPEPEPQREQEERKGEEGVLITEAAVVHSKPTPTKRRTSQKATPRTGTRQTRNTQVGSDEEPTATDETANEVSVLSVTRSTRKSRIGTKTPANQTQPVVPQTQPVVPQTQPVVPQTQPVVPQTQPVVPEEEEKKGNDEGAKQWPSSPGRVTRKSTRAGVTLGLFTQEEEVVSLTPPRSRRKTRGEGTAEKTPSALALDDPPLSGYRRPTRSRMWNHQEEDLPLLETPLEMDSVTPVADALIQRLRDEEAKREVDESTVVTEMVRAKRRVTKPSGQRAPSPPPMGDIKVTKADQGSPVRDSFIYSPPRRRTRGSRVESPGQNDVSAPPVTRTRRPVDATAAQPDNKDKNSSEDDVEKEMAAAKTRATKSRTTKPKAAPAPPPPAKVDLISPMPSPAEPAPRATRRLLEENDAPAPRMNLRRKRVLEAIFPKPVTRRKKL